MPREDRAPEGGRRWARTIAAHVRHQRRIRDWNQNEVADRMELLGYAWSQRIVSNVEQGERDVTVDEVAGLAIVFGVPLLSLIDPRGPLGDQDDALDFGSPVEAEIATAWLAGRATIELVVPDDGSSPTIRTELHNEDALRALGFYAKERQ